jgi:hypothetical protein
MISRGIGTAAGASQTDGNPTPKYDLLGQAEVRLSSRLMRQQVGSTAQPGCPAAAAIEDRAAEAWASDTKR